MSKVECDPVVPGAAIDQVTKVIMFLLYTYIKNNKHFHFSDKRNPEKYKIDTM